MPASLPTEARREDVVRAVVAALADALGHELPDVTEATRLFDDLNVDSTSVLGLLMSLEDSLDIEVDTDILEQHHLESVAALTDFLLENL
ncbi:acyl carrier protein [Streptacidiphilus rugosus]|uniref:acyl carrier protein n=1 Tax=Streptacidiphilus rugosus TaxID=405783 RepID=UPI000691DB91|nr:acyl carrier protein [Streptacidiphilus rugosus]